MTKFKTLFSAIILLLIFTSCENNESKPYILVKEDITILDIPADGFSVKIGQLLRVEVESFSDENIDYEWLMDGSSIANTKNLEYMIEVAGEYELTLLATQGKVKHDYNFDLTVTFDEIAPPTDGSTPYITKVFDYMPAVGQFTNKLPEYSEGNTQEDMNTKVLESIGNNNKQMISLGGYGGYVVVGFDHTIENKKGKRDFRVLANAFYAASNPDSSAPEGGSCEPGIILVAYDVNKNGVPDSNEWYEIEGSSHVNPANERWYKNAVENNNNVNTYFDYEITYHKPANEPTTDEEWNTYIKWEDNKNNSGYMKKNQFHEQPYYPLWCNDDKLTFKGTCLPQNGIDESGQGNYFVLYKFTYGYADNETNTKDESAIDIDWAINSKGQKVNLPGVDFIKIYTGVNQDNGWLGECSTEITGIEDLHLLNIDIDTRK